MDIAIECNTADAVLIQNIIANSRRPLKWISMREPPLPEGRDHAVICGGGPSLADTLDSIRWRHGLGQKVFALNNAAGFLAAHDIFPDYQVIVDARPHNAGFVGCAFEYLLSSQCHPMVFDKALPDATWLWHPLIERILDEDQRFVNDPRPYSLIGGGHTVGLSAMCLAYTMGYRKLHLYGYDSSHLGEATHAYAQPQNVRDPECEVEAYGRTFHCSLAMARQMELFPDVANNLIELGCVITVDGDGLLPHSFRYLWSASMPEPQKYEAIWKHEKYRCHSPGERVAERFVQIAQPSPWQVVADLGCGTGRGGKAVERLSGARVVYVDFAPNCMDEGQPILADLSRQIPVNADIGYCCDVMEHIPPGQVDDVLRNVCNVAPRIFFQIALFHDNMGAIIGQRLHLSVHTAFWWLRKLQDYGRVLHFEDHGKTAIYYLTTQGE